MGWQTWCYWPDNGWRFEPPLFFFFFWMGPFWKYGENISGGNNDYSQVVITYKYKFKLSIEMGTNLIIDGNLSQRVDWWCSHLYGWLMSSWGRLFEQVASQLTEMKQLIQWKKCREVESGLDSSFEWSDCPSNWWLLVSLDGDEVNVLGAEYVAASRWNWV